MTVHTGGCHCGAVRYEFTSEPDVVVHRCNCSICSLSGFLHLIIPRDRFRMISGEDVLTAYSFNSGIARHYFCSICGIKSWYVPRSNPDGVSVNFRCVDPDTFGEVSIVDLDGRNWEATAPALAHLSKPT